MTTVEGHVVLQGRGHMLLRVSCGAHLRQRPARGVSQIASLGIAIWAKRLETGSFQAPRVDVQSASVTLSATELTLLLRGIDLGSVKRRKRYRHTA